MMITDDDDPSRPGGRRGPRPGPARFEPRVADFESPTVCSGSSPESEPQILKGPSLDFGFSNVSGRRLRPPAPGS